MLISGRTRGEAETRRLGVVRDFEKGLLFDRSRFVVSFTGVDVCAGSSSHHVLPSPRWMEKEEKVECSLVDDLCSLCSTPKLLLVLSHINTTCATSKC